MPKKHEGTGLLVSPDAKELLKMGEEVASKIAEIVELKEKKRVANEAFNKDIQDLDARVRELADLINEANEDERGA